MKSLNQQQLLWLLAALGLAFVPHVYHLPLPLALWFVCVFGWRLLGVWRPASLPNAAIRLLLIVIGLGLLVGFHPGHWGADTGTAVFVVAMAIKLLELNRQRDAYLLSYLSLILIGAQFLFRQDMLATGYGLLVCWVLLSAMLSLNGGSLRSKTVLRQSSVMLVQALPLTIALFVLFPRMQAPALNWLDASHQAQAGLSDTLEPGSINQLALSPELVFRVKFDGEMPPTNQLYWRGPVFSFTDGKIWSVVDDNYALQYQDALAFSGKSYRYTLLLEPQKRDWVYALDMPAAYDASVQRNANYQLIGHHKPGEAVEFAIVSHPDYNTGYITKIEYRQNRQLPDEPSDAVIELVKQLQGFEDKPEVFIQRLLEYFRQQHFSYTLNPPLMEERPIDTFLFEAKTGFCNHYATAFVYLMRVADIPARVVGGYQGGTFNDVGQFLEVRQANAHAWAEVWLQGKGWVRVDPTTAILPERVEQTVNVAQQIETRAVSLSTAQGNAEKSQGPDLKQLQQLMNNLDYQWQRWVVRFGSEHEPLQFGRLDMPRLMPRVYGLLAGSGLIMFMLMRWVLRERSHKEAAEVKLYRRFCRKMAKVGVPIKPGEGAIDFASRAKAHKPELSVWIDEVTQGFVQLHYFRVPYEDNLKLFKKRIK